MESIDELIKTGVEKNLVCRECLSLILEEKENKIGTFKLMKNIRYNTVCSRGHAIHPSDEQFFSGILKQYQVFHCSAEEEISFLNNAIKIRCEKTPLTVKARICPFEQWEKIISKLEKSGLVSFVGNYLKNSFFVTQAIIYYTNTIS